MGKTTIKIGDAVIARNTHQTRVTDIFNGRYRLEEIVPGDAVNSYSATEIRKPATENKPLKRTALKNRGTPPNRMSQKMGILLQIYKILRKEFLTSNPICKARLPNCTHDATEVHHQKGKENLLLIIVKWFFPVCRSCHGKITVQSKQAIEDGLSVMRNSATEIQLSATEMALLDEYGYPDLYKVNKDGFILFSATEIEESVTENENNVAETENAAEIGIKKIGK